MATWVNKGVLTGALILGCTPVPAGDEEVPDSEFLEYLGYWEESDEEWLLFDEPYTDDSEERSDPVPQGKESTETEDES